LKQTPRRVTAAVTACFLIAAGCSAPTRKPIDLPTALVSPAPLPPLIAVVSVREATHPGAATAATAFSTDPADGALRGGAGGAAAGAATGLMLSGQAMASAFASSAANPAMLPVLGGVVLIGSIIGAISGASGAIPPERVAEIERVITSRLDELGVSESIARRGARAIMNTGTFRSEWLGDRVMDSAGPSPDYHSVFQRNVAAILEVRLRRVSFSTLFGSDPNVALVVIAEGRLVDTGTGAKATSRRVAYQSQRYPISEWEKEDGKLLRAAIARASEELGERLVDTLLLGAETSPIAFFRMAGGIVGTTNVSCSLRPIAPAPFGYALVGHNILEETTDTRLPELSWHAFPPPDWIGADARLAHIAKTVYDLRIWDGTSGEFGALVYERLGLPSPRHKVEQELRAGALYLWSVRARYQEGDRPLATRWSASQRPPFFPDGQLMSALSEPIKTGNDEQASPCTGRSIKYDSPWTPCYCLDFVPYPNHYRFRTP
jgi:hypothetical protein